MLIFLGVFPCLLAHPGVSPGIFHGMDAGVQTWSWILTQVLESPTLTCATAGAQLHLPLGAQNLDF